MVGAQMAQVAELKYWAALQVVQEVDEHLKRGTRHYRNRDGQLLETLDEVVKAIMEGRLAEDSKGIAC